MAQYKHEKAVLTVNEREGRILLKLSRQGNAEFNARGNSPGAAVDALLGALNEAYGRHNIKLLREHGFQQVIEAYLRASKAT